MIFDLLGADEWGLMRDLCPTRFISCHTQNYHALEKLYVHWRQSRTGRASTVKNIPLCLHVLALHSNWFSWMAGMQHAGIRRERGEEGGRERERIDDYSAQRWTNGPNARRATTVCLLWKSLCNLGKVYSWIRNSWEWEGPQTGLGQEEKVL